MKKIIIAVYLLFMISVCALSVAFTIHGISVYFGISMLVASAVSIATSILCGLMSYLCARKYTCLA